MILVDTSAWIEYLRRTERAADRKLDRLIESGAEIATTEIVILEILAGATGPDHRQKLRRFLYRFELLSIGDLATYEFAAELYYSCRMAGETVRSHSDCLVAAVAIRDGVELLHRDRDFEVIARHTPLKLA